MRPLAARDYNLRGRRVFGIQGLRIDILRKICLDFGPHIGWDWRASSWRRRDGSWNEGQQPISGVVSSGAYLHLSPSSNSNNATNARTRFGPRETAADVKIISKDFETRHHEILYIRPSLRNLSSTRRLRTGTLNAIGHQTLRVDGPTVSSAVQ